MEWTELRITIPAQDTDRAADIANMVVPYGIYIEDYRNLEQDALEIAHINLIDEDLLKKDRTRSIIHIYISPEENPTEAAAFLRERFSAENISHELLSDQIREEDWAQNWKAYFKPLLIGDRLLICPSWEEVPASDRTILSIDPGMAFGTGGHDTTRLVLESMEKFITPDTALLDVGCGSGILSIAALLLGGKTAVGVDIDPLAVKTAIENGELNDLRQPRYNILQGDLVDKIHGQYDVVVANIVADAIIALSPSIPRFLKPGGVYITSGIIDTREAEVQEALTRCGFTLVERREQKGWLCFICRL